MRVLWFALIAAAFGEAAVFLFMAWPRTLRVHPMRVVQVTQATAEGPRIYMPGRSLVGRLGEYHNPLFAFLMFDYYRTQPELKGRQLLLKNEEASGGDRYSIWVRLPDDLIRGTYLLAALRDDHLAPGVQYRWVTKEELETDESGTAMLEAAYSKPAPDALEQLDEPALEVYLSSFIRFKSLTDYRIEHGTDPGLTPLSVVQAVQLANDMIAVAHFYNVPLGLMLGIGAMENNYMNTPGDLKHTVWKRRPERGDVVLERRRHRVLVKDNSIGVWQITRKTLRRAQELYRKDKRDYAELPEWLQPPKKLDLDNVPPAVLTTYAGLLLRDLLDHSGDDVMKAAGAYNGTLKHPNLHYAEGVQLVAEYAQRIAGNAATVDPLPADQFVWKQALEEQAVTAVKVMPQNALMQTSLVARPMSVPLKN